jgi:hypothetical protein
LIKYFVSAVRFSNLSIAKVLSHMMGLERHINERLAKHKTSVEHITNLNTWNELGARIDKDETINIEI